MLAFGSRADNERAVTLRVLLISGSMGSGKTTVMAEASDILAANSMAHAAIDVDALAIVHAPAVPDDLVYRNLAAVWRNYAAAGVDTLLLAYAVDNQAALNRVQETLPGAEVIVCRLRAPLETMQQRVRSREPGFLQQQFVARVAELETLLDRADVEDFTINNAGRSVTEVAREMLTRAGWL
jgi:hypothetical protein